MTARAWLERLLVALVFLLMFGMVIAFMAFAAPLDAGGPWSPLS